MPNGRFPTSDIPSQEWQQFREVRDVWPGVSVWVSHADDDPRWDSFLLGTPLGQFQQSCAWGRVKRIEGWQPVRFMVEYAGTIIAGFQLLWKRRCGVRFGYVSKGPVVPRTPQFSDTDAIELLQRAARLLGLSALITQVPDLAGTLEAPISVAGFVENHLHGVYSATVLVDLARPFEEVQAAFSHDVGRQIRKLRNNAITTRFGGEEDADVFFSMMKNSCAKQGVAPNPGRAESLRAILREFKPSSAGAINPIARFLFAEREGHALAGFLLIRFGERLSLWKKGVAAEPGRPQPNRLLDCEAMRWGHSLGCRWYDEVAIDRPTAEALLDGRQRVDVPMKPSDSYKLDFGGTPVLLPRSQFWSPHRVVRALCRMSFRRNENPEASSLQSETTRGPTISPLR